MLKGMKILAITAMIGVFVLLLGTLILALLWHAPVLAVLCALWGIIFVPLKLRSTNIWLLRGVFLLCLIGLTFMTYHMPFQEMDSRMKHFRVTLNQSGPNGLSLTDKMAIYGSNIYLGLGGFTLGYPEVAMETLLLCIPGPSVRTFNSDFPMNSAKVRQPLQEFIRKLKTLPEHTTTARMPETYVAWSNYFSDSPRVSLALNPFRLSAQAKRQENGWHIACSGWVPVRYPQRSWTPFFRIRGHTYHIEEGVYWALQQIGWLFPYKAVWQWEIDSHDLK